VAAHRVVAAAVFSISSGILMSVASTALRQLSNPLAGSSPSWMAPPWTISPFAPIDAAASMCCWSSLRPGMRWRLLVVATLMRYGACT
jgi:hypothetical protein